MRVPLVNSTADKACGELFVFVNLRQDGLQNALAVAVQAAWRGYVQRRRLPPILYGVSIIQVGCGLSFQSIRVRGLLRVEPDTVCVCHGVFTRCVRRCGVFDVFLHRLCGEGTFFVELWACSSPAPPRCRTRSGTCCPSSSAQTFLVDIPVLVMIFPPPPCVPSRRYKHYKWFKQAKKAAPRVQARVCVAIHAQ